MKKKTLFWLLLAEAIIYAAITYLTQTSIEIIPEVMSFPFYQLIQGLKALAALGSLGAGFAMLIYALVSLSPICILFFIKKKDAWKIISVIFSSVSLAIGLFTLANPALISNPYLSNLEQAAKIYRSISALVCWGGIILLVCVFIIRNIQSKPKSVLFSYTNPASYILCMTFFYTVCGVGAVVYTMAITNQSNFNLYISILTFHISATVFVFQTRTVFLFNRMINAYRQKDEASIVAVASKKASRSAGFTIMLTIFLYTLLNIVKLVLSRYILNLSVSLDIPLVPMAMLILLLILADVIEKNSRLSEDNDLII